MTIEVEVQDSEQLVVAFLRPLLLDDGFTCGRRVPDKWTKTDPGHVQVVEIVPRDDAEHLWPVLVHPTIELRARGGSIEDATSLCGRAVSLLMAKPNDNRGISGCRLNHGPVPDREAETGDEIAVAEIRATIRTIQVA